MEGLKSCKETRRENVGPRQRKLGRTWRVKYVQGGKEMENDKYWRVTPDYDKERAREVKL